MSEFVSPLRIRSKMNFVYWCLEVLFAVAFLLCEGILQIFFRITRGFPFLAFWLFGKTPPSPPPRSDADLDIDRDFVDLVRARGYDVEEHFAKTQDGYILTLHRILPKKRNNNISDQNNTTTRKVVYFQHGMMQCSEVWVARSNPKQALPYLLVELGYDVWCGNNRGNKYSHKHVSLSPINDSFWDYCIDDLALKDVPTMIDYVLRTTRSSKLTYIGFSQGTAQGFAAFSSIPELAEKINLFVALAPVSTVNELRNEIVAAISTSRPQFVYLLFGRKALLPSTLFWRRVLSKRVFVWVIDFFLDFLFGWKSENIDPAEKALLYSHLYSFISVKCVVHWFQITHTQRFQMYDNNIVTINRKDVYKGYLLPRYNITQITCPIAVFYGARDTIPNNVMLLETLPSATYIHKEETYEHLDFLYGRNVDTDVYEKVLKLVEQYSSSEHNAETAGVNGNGIKHKKKKHHIEDGIYN